MFLKVLRDFSRPHWVEIVQELKSSTGLSVAELSKRIGMSYMGVKQHCQEMEKRGYLDSWRRPGVRGRPEKAYRLTPKADPLFPEIGAGFALQILDGVKQVYGATAPDKLMFGSFQKEADRYLSKVRGDTLEERAASLAKIRDLEGYRSTVEADPEAGLAIVEYHSLIAPLADKFPSVYRLEEAMFGKILRTTVERTEEQFSGLTKIRFHLDADG